MAALEEIQQPSVADGIRPRSEPDSFCYTDLTSFVAQEELKALDEYLLAHIPHLAAQENGKLFMPEGQVCQTPERHVALDGTSFDCKTRCARLMYSRLKVESTAMR